MDETSVKSPRFDWRMSESYYMSIQLSLDGLSFCILDPVTNTFLMLGNVDFKSDDKNFAEHEKYILCQKAFSYRYRKVLISIESPAFMVMPLSLYDDNRIRSVLALVGIKISDDDKILRNNIDLANSTTVFAIPNFLYFFLRTQFPNAEIFHSTTPVVSSMLLKTFGNNVSNALHVVFNDDSMTISATENNELKLCNRFYCKEPMDYVYMVLFVINQLQFAQQHTHILVSGNVSDDDARVKTLKRFSRHVRLAQPPRFFNYGFRLPEASQKFNSLFLLPLCV